MKNNQIVFPSSQVDSTLPLWIRTPDVVVDRGVETRLDGQTITRNKYRSENHKNFVNFMTKAAESEERIGFGQDILQNLLKYRDFDTYKNQIIQYNYLAVDGVVSIDNVTYDNLDTSAGDSVLAAVPTGDAYELLVGVDNEQAKRRYVLRADEEDVLELVNGYGFPEENGVVLIDDEVILYRRREGNRCFNLQRGASATTILPHLRSRGEYVRTEAADHYAGSVVVNLSVLFLVSLLETIHKTYAEDIDASRVAPEINRSTLLQNIKDFFRSKGSKLGIKALFKILFAENDVEVFYPGDRMINPSESTWSENLIIRTVPIPFVFADPEDNYTTPENVIGSEILFKSYLDDELYARSYVDYSMTYQYEGQTQYELYLNKDEFEGDCPVNTFTYLTRKLFIAGFGAPDDERKDTLTVTVESTLGFPDKGVIFIDNEAIFYGRKTPNQFLDCKRGYIGVNSTHNKGSYVYGPYYVETRITDKEGDTYVSRSWPMGLVESVEIKNPGLLHRLDDIINVNDENGRDMPGRVDPREPILCQITNDEFRSIFSITLHGNSVLGVVDDDPNSILNLNGINPAYDFPPELESALKYTFTENYNDELVFQITTQPDRLAFVGNITWGPDGIYFDDDYVFVSSSGFPESSVGFFNTNGSNPEVGPDMLPIHVLSVIPRRENIKLNFTEPKGTDTIGVFVDGVRAFSNVSPENVKHGKIGHFEVIKQGSGYKNPTVVITPSNSTAECVVDPIYGRILEVKSTSVGFYNDNPIVRISSGEGATFKPVFDNYGRIVSVQVLNGGLYYNDPPKIFAVDRSGVGLGCLLSCEVDGGVITGVNVINSGRDYGSQSTVIVTETIGSGAEVDGITEFYSINRYEEVIRNSTWTFDDGGGFLYELQPGRTRSLYGYVAAPPLLRKRLGDDGSDHSPILGWAFDGNPIYGPYGYTNNTDGDKGVERQVSAYKKRKSRLGIVPGGSETIGSDPPSPGQFAMGYFVEDFEYAPYQIAEVQAPVEKKDGYLASEVPELLETTGPKFPDHLIEVETIENDIPGEPLPNWILDKNNGKICNTPDFPVELYPDGVYCYFLTVDEDDTPVFPYIIGETFENFPLDQDLEFDYKEVERLRNPYLKSTRRDLKLEIGGIQSGSISGVEVQDGGSANNRVGDYVFFDNTNTSGAGAQGVISYLEGVEVVKGSGDRLETQIISHRQLLDFTNNIDDNNNVDSFTFVKDKEIRSFSVDNYARSTVSDYDARFRELKCQTFTNELIQSGDGMYDHNRQFLTVGDVEILPEVETTKRLWVNDIRNFEVGDIVEIDNGSIDDEFRPNELVKIDQIYSSGSMVVIRGYQGDPYEIDDQTTIHNTSRYVYTVETSTPHNMILGDVVKISGSQYDEINGEHTLISVDDNVFVFNVSQQYEEETEITYITNSDVATGPVAEIKMTSSGYGYESLPKVDGIVKSSIDKAITHINLRGSTIGSVEVRYGGTRYVSPKAVFVDATNSGQGATADVEVKDGKVVDIVITNRGTGYLEPALYLVENDGKYIATTDDIGGIKSVKVIDPGRNISADLSLKPELQITTRLVVQFEEGDFFTVDDQVYQGIETNMMCTANVIGYDNQRQILIVDDVFGNIKAGEYIYNTDGVKAMVLVSGQSDCRVQVDDVAKPAGDFIDDKSKVSEAYAVIQDSYRYQWFSYVISSPLQQMEYDTFVREIVHPAGFIQFGDVSIHDSTQSGSMVIDESPFVEIPESIVPLLVSRGDGIPIVVNKDSSTEFWINT